MLLVLINLTFLGLIAIDAIQMARLQSEMRTELVRTLEGMGVSIDESQIPRDEEQAPYFLSRDILTEGRIAVAVLGGQATTSDEGGGIFRYLGQTGYGEGEIRSGTFRFQVGAQELGEESSGQIIRQLELSVRDSQFDASKLDNWMTYVYPLTFNNVLVVNGHLTFTFCVDAGMLEEISGTALWGSSQRNAGSPQLDVTTALISLAGHLLEIGGVSRFESVETGYYLLEGTGLLELRPVWVVQTDAGTFSIDRQSGEIRS